MATKIKKTLSSRPVSPSQPAPVAFSDYSASIAAIMLLCGLLGVYIIFCPLIWSEADSSAFQKAFSSETVFNFIALVSSTTLWKILLGFFAGASGGFFLANELPKELLARFNFVAKIILIMVPVFLIYFPVMKAGFIWDDDQEITANPSLHDWNGLKDIWAGTKSADYFPLKTTMLWLEFHFWAVNAGAYHTVNFILHAIDSVLVWQVLRRLKVPGAWLAGFVFAVYPVHVESVAWIAERKNTLSLLFYLVGLLAWFNFQEKKSRHLFVNFFTGFSIVAVFTVYCFKAFVPEGGPAMPNSGTNAGEGFLLAVVCAALLFGINWALQKISESSVACYFYVAAMIFFVAGLLCKTHLVVLPFVLLLISWWQNDFSGIFHDPLKEDELEERLLMKISNFIIGCLGVLGGLFAFFYLWAMNHCYHLYQIDPGGTFLGHPLKEIQDYIKSTYMMKTGEISAEFWLLATVCVISGIIGLIEGLAGLRINRVLVRSLAFFQIAVLLGALTVWFQYGRAIGDERIPLGGMPSKVANAGKASWWYLTKSVFPVNPWYEMPSRQIETEADAMAIVYDKKKSDYKAPALPIGTFKVWPLMTIYPRWRITPPVWYDFIPALMMAALVVLLWIKRHQWGRTPFFVLAYFLVTLLPVLGFLKMSYMRLTLVADHFQYMSDISVIAFFCAGATLLWQRFSPSLRPVLMGAGVVLLGSFVLYSSDRVKIYESEFTLWGDVLNTAQKLGIFASWQAHNHMGAVLFTRRMVPEATRHFWMASWLKPENPESHNNLGLGYVSQGWMDAGIEQYRKAIEIRNWEPSMHTNLGNSLGQMKRYDEAITEYKEAIRLNKLQNREDPAPNCNLGYVLLQRGEIDEAIHYLQEAVRIDPNMQQAQMNLNAAMQMRNSGVHFDKAISDYTAALRANPNDPVANCNLGTVYLQMGHIDEAIQYLRRALEIDPNLSQAKTYLDVAMQMRSRAQEQR